MKLLSLANNKLTAIPEEFCYMDELIILQLHIINRLSSAKCCPNPACGGVYFDSQYKQIKFADFCGRYRMPLMQFLCSPNCMTEDSEESSSSSDDELPINPARLRRVLLG